MSVPRYAWHACRDAAHRGRWRVQVRQANYSTFNGGHRTPSAYSLVRCLECGHAWRTKAAYVADLPDLVAGEGT